MREDFPGGIPRFPEPQCACRCTVPEEEPEVGSVVEALSLEKELEWEWREGKVI